MDTVYFLGGLIVGGGLSYVWYLVGRNTAYQDKNVVPPPPPITLPKLSGKKKEPKKPAGWVDDFTDPPLGSYRPGGDE